jgi:putative FmdB family regulatory protein
MPIYEFYCRDCHTVFNFLSRTIDTKKRPTCPRCSRPRLQRRASTFAVGGGHKEQDDADLPAGLDARQMERAMEGLAREAESAGGDDNRAMAGLMRRFYENSGAPMGRGMSEALARLEAGEDAETIEAQMGDVLEAEDPFGGCGPSLGGVRRSVSRPDVDPELYEL